MTSSGLSGYARRMAAIVQQNDPSELLEVFDWRGRPTGVGKPRSTMHLGGHWHKTFHCWIVRPGPAGVELVLQRRALAKDTYPGGWDASSAGHWRFGESPAEAARELEEELGVSVPFERLEWVGQERKARSYASGLIDRELDQVYALLYTEPLLTYHPDPAEVSGAAAIAATDLLARVAGRMERAPASEAISVADDGKVQTEAAWIERESLVPYSAARMKRLLSVANRLLRAR